MTRAALSALGAVALGVALQISSGMFDPWALTLATAATGLAVAAAFVGNETRTEGVAQIVFGFGILHGLWCHVFEVPTFYANPARLQGFRALALFAALFCSAYLCVHLRASLQKARFRGALAVFAAMGAAILAVSAAPRIDVFLFRQISANALSAGVDPYSISYPDLYARTGETLKMYGPRLVSHGRVLAFPYPPLTVLLDAPIWRLFHDVRVLSLLAMGVAAWAIARLSEGPVAELSAVFLLFQGRSFFVLEQAWSEPLVLASFALTLLLIARRAHWAWIGLAAGALAASKQYSPLLLVPLSVAVPREERVRVALLALGVVVATALPFAAWDLPGLYRGVVEMQFLQPLRLDSLSLLAAYARQFGAPSWGALPAFVAAAAVLLLTLRQRLSVAAAAGSAAAAWLILILLNKQAFCNYDWLGGGLLCCAAAARGSKEQDP